MLTSISIQGFKSLLDIPKLELGQVNVFIGANGSGKSSLLEAMGVLSAASGGRLDDPELLRRGVRPSPLIHSSFKDINSSGKIKIHADWIDKDNKIGFETNIDRIDYSQEKPWSYNTKDFFNDQELTPESDPKFVGSFEIINGVPESTIKYPKYLNHPVFKHFHDVLYDYAIFNPDTPTLQGIVADITQRSPVGLKGGRLAEAVDNILTTKNSNKDIVNSLSIDDFIDLFDWMSGVQVWPPSSNLISPNVPTVKKNIIFDDRWMPKGQNKLSAYEASEGALYLLFALVLAIHPISPRLFSIENLDQAMHPRLARAAIRLFSQQILNDEKKRQVLLTTHNPLVLDGLDLMDDRIRLFTVERNHLGATRIDRVQVSEEFLQSADGELGLSDLWIMGRLGGVPNIF